MKSFEKFYKDNYSIINYSKHPFCTSWLLSYTSFKDYIIMLRFNPDKDVVFWKILLENVKAIVVYFCSSLLSFKYVYIFCIYL